MPVKSLIELATSVIMRNIRRLESVGEDLPYDNVRSILLQVHNAAQLRQIELNSPQLQGHTGECWLKLIERDFPLEYRSTAYKPSDPTRWYKVWEKYKKEHDQALKESEQALKNALMGINSDRTKNTSRIVEQKYLPRKGRSVNGSSRLAFTAGSRTKTTTGADIMRKVRREAKEIANARALSRPTQAAINNAPMQAPRAMLEARRREAQPSAMPDRPAEASFKPEKRSGLLTISALEEHVKHATVVSDSEDDADYDSLQDDSDGQSRPVVTSKASMKTPVRAPAKNPASTSLLKSKPRFAPAPISSKPAEERSSNDRSSRLSRAPVERSPPPRRPAVPVTSTASPAKPAASRLFQKFGSKPSSKAPVATRPIQSSPPPTSSSATAGDEASSNALRAAKRKAPTDIFMRAKKRAV